jgi:hypothetical protein
VNLEEEEPVVDLNVEIDTAPLKAYLRGIRDVSKETNNQTDIISREKIDVWLKNIWGHILEISQQINEKKQ